MDTENDRNRIVRRIVLPSGKTIEVLQPTDPTAPRGLGPDPLLDAAVDPGPSFEAREDSSSPPAASAHPEVCPSCDSRLVYPVAWEAAGDELWRVELRCPNCEHLEEALLELEVAERFDEELETGSETLMNDLARLAEANMLEDVERLAAALAADALLPSDF